MKRYLALDVGDARIGVALSDESGMFAHPHSTVTRSGKKTAAEIAALTKETAVSGIVVGVPFELDGTFGEQAEKVDVFVAQLQKELLKDDELAKVDIHFIDERLTTSLAERIVVGTKLKNADKRAALDRVSASLILETFLSQQATS